jgi:hypothetical protein
MQSSVYWLYFLSGLLLLIYQILIYPLVAKSIDPITLVCTIAVRLCSACLINLSHTVTFKLIKYSDVQVLTIPLLSSYPFMPALSGFILKLAVNCASFLKNSFSVSAKILAFSCGTELQVWACSMLPVHFFEKYISSLIYLCWFWLSITANICFWRPFIC